MARSNTLDIHFNHEEINKKYDFYLISTTEKYIDSGSYILDKPIDAFKAESIVFDNGKTLFVMFRKNSISKYNLIQGLIDQNITIKQLNSIDIKDYILFKLFLYSLNNYEYEDNVFNNITGKLFITNPKWISRNKKTFKALSISIDNSLNITMEATTFTNTSLFNKKTIANYPMYTFSNKNYSLKRTFDKDCDSYIRKNYFGTKAEICFLDISDNDRKNSKVYCLYKTLDLFKNKFKDLCEFSFKDLELIESIGKYRDKDFMDKCYKMYYQKRINIVDLTNNEEYKSEFLEIVNLFKETNPNVIVSNSVKKDCWNLVYLHNQEYYRNNNYDDLYEKFSKDCVIQHITVEDCSDKLLSDNQAIFNSIIKEFVIKEDILFNKKITIDNWDDLCFDNDFIFGKEFNNYHYFMIVHPSGEFEFVSKCNDFSSSNNEMINKMSVKLTDNKGKEKTIIANEKHTIMICRTNKYILPSEGIFEEAKISRSNESRTKYLSGVVDINLFNDNMNYYYNAGLKGSGMNTKVVKAPILYQVESEKELNIITDILETFSVPFVKYKEFTIMPYPIKYLNEYILMQNNK